MRSIRSRVTFVMFVVVAFTCFVFIPGSPGQDTKEPPKPPASRARPIPAVDFHIPWMGMKIFAMHAESNKPVLGKPTAPASDLRYFYLPLMAFQKKGTGELDVAATDEGEVTLPIIYDSEEARQAVRDYLVKEKLIPADSMPGQIMTVAAKVWYLESPPGYEPRVRFGPYENFQFGMKGKLTTRLSPDHARKFVTDLKAGKIELHPTIVFDGYAYQDNTVVVYADDILTSDQYKKLTGPGGKGFVGRHQVARIAREACLTRGVAVTTEYHDSDFNDLVTKLVANFAKKESKPMANWEAVEKFFKDADWDPNDFKADLIEAAKMNQNKEFRETFSQEIEKASSGGGGGGLSFSIGAYSIGLNGNGQSADSEKSKVFRDVLDKWSISNEWNGKMYIPKSIDVYTLNSASIRQTSSFAVGKRKKTVSDGILTVAVNPNDNVLHSKATPAYEEKLAELARRKTKRVAVYIRGGPKAEAVPGNEGIQQITCDPKIQLSEKDPAFEQFEIRGPWKKPREVWIAPFQVQSRFVEGVTGQINPVVQNGKVYLVLSGVKPEMNWTGIWIYVEDEE